MYADAPVVGAPCPRAQRLLPRLRSRARARCIRCGSGIGYQRLERPVAAVERARQGTAVRLPDVRPVRPELDRHVLPDELPEEPAQRPVRRRARQRQLRSAPRDEVRVGRGGRRQRAHPRRHARRSRTVQVAVDRRLQGRSSWLRVARERAGGSAVSFEDEPVPGYPLPILPGHTSPGPLRARAARRAVRGHQRARAAGLGRSGGRLPPRPHLRRLRRCDQRHRRQRRQLPHVEPRRVRAADPRRLRAGDADLLPRQEPHRHPGRHPGRRRDGRVQPAVPHRRRRAGGRPSAGHCRCSTWTRCRCSTPRARCATSTAS